ncbi:MAG: hypothetical protein HFH37_06355 [Lachnospiraceae bacterium]|nr:hypothetical protein [Lachnospiraceae bacterium]
MNEREDYLDKLLRGVEGESEVTKDEDDFFSHFGSSVSDDDEDDFLKAFEKSKSASKDKSDSGSGDDLDFDLDDIDNIVSNIKNGTLDDLDSVDSLDDGKDLSIEESLKNYDDDFGLNDVGAAYMDDASEPEADSDFEVNTLDGDADPDYNSGEVNQELLDMLSEMGEEEPQEEEPLANLSSADEADFMGEDFVNTMSEEPGGEIDLQEAEPENAGDGMEDLARQLESLGLEDMEDPNEVTEHAEAFLPEEDTKKKSKKGKKESVSQDTGEKVGLFKRISLALFGEDDKVIDASDVDSLSEEDKEDLKKIEDEAAAKEKKKQEKSAQKEEQKEQKKKDKEEKKAQKAKVKAEKEKKPKKEKKKKDLKVIERSKPLPKGPVILIMLVGISLVILINLFSSQVGYMLSVSQARESYDQGDYVEAYSCFTQGAKVKAVDEELYNKARLTAYVHQQIKNYRVYKKQNMHAEALSALILGVGRYDKNAAEAAATGAAVEYDKMLSTIEKALKKQYSMTLDQARELYDIWEKEEFTLEVYKIIDELGLGAEEEE